MRPVPAGRGADQGGRRGHPGGRPGRGHRLDRGHLDTLHAHLTELHRFIDQLAEVAGPPHP
ncbi:DUF6238 family protein, partial [Streptomyces sp. NPDC003514]